MAISRRLFLKNGGVALAAVGFAPAFLRRAVFAAEPSRGSGKKVLVCLFQRGAVDGLNMVVPHGDPDYYKLRPTLAIPRPGVEASAIDLDGFFGLHPALSGLMPLYKAGRLAVVHACGSPDATRSHFDAQDFMESAAPGNKTIATGWLARALEQCPEDAAHASALRAVSLTGSLPRSLQGDPKALAISDLRSFGLSRTEQNMQAAYEAMYGSASDASMRTAGRDSFEAMRVLKGVDPRRYAPAGGAVYPPGRVGEAMKQIAQLIKANVGLEIAFADCGGWDTHVNEGGAQGQLATRLSELGRALAAFSADLGDAMADVVTVTMSEFGRTARENGNGGTDHGHATCFLVLGGPVKGGKVYGRWPGLAPGSLNEGRDLALTTDFRDVFAEVAARHLGARNLAAVFPGFSPST